MPRAPPWFQTGTAEVQGGARPIIEFPTPIRTKNRTDAKIGRAKLNLNIGALPDLVGNQWCNGDGEKFRFGNEGRVNAGETTIVYPGSLGHFMDGLDDDRRIGVLK